MTFHQDDPRNQLSKIHIIAHDVARSSDFSTAVVGGLLPSMLGPRLLGVKEFHEIPRGIYGSELASAVAGIDQMYNRDCLIVADLSNDPTYGEILYDMFGRRLIGVHICSVADGTTFERRQVRNGVFPVYRVGRSFLLELLASQLREGQICWCDTAEARRTFAQLEALEPEQREKRIIYKCPTGQHDDLAISLAMLAWAAQHLDFDGWWCWPIFDAHKPRRVKVDAAAMWLGAT